MSEFLRAWLWLQVKLARNSLSAARDLGRTERLSRWAEYLLPMAVLAFFVPAAALLAAFAFVVGRVLPEGGNASRVFDDAAGTFGVPLTLAVLFAPLLRSVGGVTTGYTRLRLLPVPRRALHLCEVLSGLGDPWLLLVLPSCLALPIGMAAVGASAPAVVALLAAAGLLLALAGLRLLAASTLALVLRTRRRAEGAYLILIALISMLPILLYFPGAAGGLHGVHIALSAQPPGAPGGRIPAAGRWLPSYLYARAIGSAARGEAVPALASLGALSLEAALLYAASRAGFDRLSDRGGEGGTRRGAASPRIPLLRLPLVPAAVAALASVHLRQLARTVRGKTVLYVQPLLVVLTGLLLTRTMPGHAPGLLQGGEVLALGGIVLTLLSLQDLSVNQFASDRGALEREWLSPLTAGQLIAGKSLAGALLASGSWLLCLGLVRWLRPATSAPALVAAFLVGLSTAVLLGPASALLAVYLPRGGGSSRTWSQASIHPLASLLAASLVLGLSLPALGTFFAGRVFFPGGWATPLLLLGWTALALLLALPLYGLAADALSARRETLFLVSRSR